MKTHSSVISFEHFLTSVATVIRLERSIKVTSIGKQGTKLKKNYKFFDCLHGNSTIGIINSNN